MQRIISQTYHQVKHNNKNNNNIIQFLIGQIVWNNNTKYFSYMLVKMKKKRPVSRKKKIKSVKTLV